MGEYLMLILKTEEWDTNSESFKDQEFAIMDYKGSIK